MHGANGHYGHRSILCAYAGMPEGTPVPGLVQHGWNHDLGATLVDVNIPKPEPFFAWTRANLMNCHETGVRHALSFGAPFLYMPPAADPPVQEPRSLLAIPVHSWEREQIPHDFEKYAAALEKLGRDFTTIRVCLYWFDHQFAASRRPFEQRGFEVVTAGHRDANPAFLPTLRDLLLRHSHVTSNRAQTGLFYGLYLGRAAFLYGPPMGLDGRFDHSGWLFDAWQRLRFPELQWEQFQGDARRDIGERELGAEYKLDPEALRTLLLWQPDQRAELDLRVGAYAARNARGAQRALHRLSGRMRAATELLARSDLSDLAARHIAGRPTDGPFAAPTGALA